jgi:hypothetical protein
MNNTIYFDERIDDGVRRSRLFAGQLFVYSPTPSSLAFVEFAQRTIAAAFAPLDPQTAQHQLPVQEYADILGRLKPAFTHHPEGKQHIRGMFAEMGCDLDKTYFDVPKLRSSTSDNYLTTGIAYAWHPHRDTWYSALPSQVNWWIPIYGLASENAMAIHPRYWGQPVRNNSGDYNYYEANVKNRGAHVAKLVQQEVRLLPGPLDPIEIDPQIRLVCPPGGIVLFSAAQLHSSVPNTSGVTRFSIDFRVAHIDDVAARRGAPNVDAACTGSNVRDFMRATDLAQLPADVIALYNDGTEDRGMLRYVPEPAVVATPSPGASR